MEKQIRKWIRESQATKGDTRKEYYSKIATRIDHPAVRRWLRTYNGDEILVDVLRVYSHDSLVREFTVRFWHSQVLRSQEYKPAKRCLESLGNLKYVEAQEALERIIRFGEVEDFDIIIGAAHELASMNEATSWKHLDTLIEDQKAEIRHAVVFGLEGIRSEESVGILLKAICDEDRHIMIRARLLLVQMPELATPPLLALLRENNQLAFRNAGAHVLAIIARKTQDERIVDALAAAFDQARDKPFMKAVIGRLADINSERAKSVLVRIAADHPTQDVRDSARRSLEFLESSQE